MSDLKVDYDQLGDLVRHLDLGLAAMQAESDTSDQIADAAGDGTLASKIRSFGSSWEVHRLHIGQELAWLKTSIENIREQLEAVDTKLASVVTGPDQQTRANQ